MLRPLPSNIYFFKSKCTIQQTESLPSFLHPSGGPRPGNGSKPAPNKNALTCLLQWLLWKSGCLVAFKYLQLGVEMLTPMFSKLPPCGRPADNTKWKRMADWSGFGLCFVSRSTCPSCIVKDKHSGLVVVWPLTQHNKLIRWVRRACLVMKC